MADPAPPSWLATHASELIAYLMGASGVIWKLLDLRAARRKEDLDETAVVANEWRQLRTELRAEISALRDRNAEQEKAISSQRERIYELTAINAEMTRKNEELREEIERLESLLSRHEAKETPA